MEQLYSSPSEAKIKEFQEKGYKKFTQPTPPKYCIPNEREYFAVSSVIFVASVFGRHYARKNFFPHAIFSANIICIPLFYLVAFNYLYVDKRFLVYKKNPTFNDLLEHYPVTRRAWKRALIVREQEMNKIKASLSVNN